MRRQNSNMIKKAAHYMGLPIIYIGVIILLVTHLLDIGKHNFPHLIGLALIIIGIIGYIVNDKCQNNY